MRTARNLTAALMFTSLVAGCDGDGKGAASSSGEKGEPGKLGAVQVAAGLGAACALMSDGTVRCWGRNDVGEMGTPKAEDDAATPVAVPGVTKAKTIWMGGDSGSSSDMVCVSDEAGEVTCWGSARLKPEKSKDSGEKWKETPEKIPHLAGIGEIALGGGTIYALMKDGSVQGWGSPAFNAFGDGDTSSFDKPMTKVPVEKATALAAGQNHACALIEGGTVQCWGYVTPKQAPKAIEGLKGVKAIAAGSGGSDTCAILGDGSVQCWGDRQEPKTKEGLSKVKMIRARTHFCALTEGGEVFCWGNNGRGQLGNGKVGDSVSTPAKVEGLSGVVHIDAGSQATCAALKDGSVKCWGYNQRGQLGDGTLMDRSKPVSVVGVNAEKLAPAKDGTDEVQEADVAMDWSGLPANCTKPTKIAAKNDKLKGDFTVVSAYAKSQLDGKTVTVDLASYKLDPKKSDPPRGKQFKLNLRFGKVNVDTKDAFKVDLGEYVFGLKEERKVASSVSHKAGGTTLMTLSLAGVSPGTVTITHLDDQWVCGELKLKTKTSEFTGPYAARIVK